MVRSQLRRRVGLTLLVLLFLPASLCRGWEFSLFTHFTWEYYQFSQLGTDGFFGPFNQDRSSVAATVNLAARNGWLGHEITNFNFAFDNLTSGSDAAANYLYTTLYPLFRANKALSIQGTYRIGSWADPSQDTSAGLLVFSRYLNSQAQGIDRSFSPGYWNLWYATVVLPWGEVKVGKQPNTLSLGFTLDTSEHTCEGVNVVAPFGPFSFGWQYYVWSPGPSVNYPLKTDRSGTSFPHFSVFLLYEAGNFSSHTYIEYSNGHQGPESQLLQNASDSGPGRINYLPLDVTLLLGFTNFKYFDGRFFFNAEVGTRQDFYVQSRSQSGATPRTRYWELWGGMIETGACSGPAKISFLWAYYPGPDRRAGQLIDRQPYLLPFLMDGGINVYKPYSLLLGYNYGSGNGSITTNSNHGFFTDASTYAVRFDYALAANLNAFATFLYAQRVSQGYGWGWIRPNPTTTPATPSLQYGLQWPPLFPTNLGFATDAPNILERELGYEIGGGINWQLVEGYLFRARVAYWKPGAWFKYACVDRTQPNWDIPNAGNRWGINPNRQIDPVFGMRVAVELAF